MTTIESTLRIGVIGERRNQISEAMLNVLLETPGLEPVWFVEADIPDALKNKMYGKPFDYGPFWKWIIQKRKKKKLEEGPDNQAICTRHGLTYLVPEKQRINSGLPSAYYEDPEVDYVLIAGCDQLLKDGALRLAKTCIINYHYSPLPAYRGKYSLFWQWYHREPVVGYTFHKVDEGIDTGEIVYQNELANDKEEDYQALWNRVVEQSAKRLPEVFQCLESGVPRRLENVPETSYFPSSTLLDLTTVGPDKTIKDVKTLLDRLGSFRLANGINLNRILSESKERTGDTIRLEKDGFRIPLKDGEVLATRTMSLPFSVYRLIFGKRLASGLNRP